VKLPSVTEQEPEPPTGRQFLTLLDNVRRKHWVLAFVLQEQTGMHIGEVVSFTWGDVDMAERKIRLRFANVKAGIRARARTVQVPDWVMDAIEATCPFEDRTADRKVFMGLTEDAARQAMGNACKLGGIPHFTPKVSGTAGRRSGITAGCPPGC
jgi:integrase